MRVNSLCTVLATALILGGVSAASAADDGVWSVGKSSGEVWITTTGVEQVALTQEEALKPGDTIRTGHNGRVLLVRGEETILIAPNSVIGLPTEKKDGLATTILQQAGSILLEVEKEERQAFRSGDAVSRSRGQGHAVQRHRQRQFDQRQRQARPGRSLRFQVGPDCPGDAGAGCDHAHPWQARAMATEQLVTAMGTAMGTATAASVTARARVTRNTDGLKIETGSARPGL